MDLRFNSLWKSMEFLWALQTIYFNFLAFSHLFYSLTFILFAKSFCLNEYIRFNEL